MNFNFLFEQFKNFTLKGHFFGGAWVCLLPQKLPNLFQSIAPQTTSYIMSFNFLC